MSEQSWTVRQVMTPRERIVTALPETPFKELAARLRDAAISAVPVVDAEDRVVGVVSEADLLVKQEIHRPLDEASPPKRLKPADGRRAEARRAADLMTSPPITVPASAPIGEAARVMHARGVKRLPVVDTEGHLLGIVSRRDLLRVFARDDQEIADELGRELREFLWLDPAEVAVDVRDGVVRLVGRVETSSLAQLAGRLARGVAGVVGVRNELTWARDDHDIRLETSPLALSLATRDRGRI